MKAVKECPIGSCDEDRDQYLYFSLQQNSLNRGYLISYDPIALAEHMFFKSEFLERLFSSSPKAKLVFDIFRVAQSIL
jgi:hypothetical protein